MEREDMLQNIALFLGGMAVVIRVPGAGWLWRTQQVGAVTRGTAWGDLHWRASEPCWLHPA